MNRFRLACLLILPASLLASCGDDGVSGCVSAADCEDGESCINGFCTPGSDRDSGGRDSGGRDGGGRDGGDRPDIDDFDGGEPDAGPAICGAACDTGVPCEVGSYDCATGEPVCVAVGAAEAGTACREAAGACDAEEVCDGTSMECPADGRVAAGTECRGTDGNSCDVAETCDGESPACPLDGFAATGTSCSGGFCDGSGTCSDTCTPGAACDPGVPCRTGTVSCDSGVPECRLDGNEANGTTCDATENGAWGACSYGGTCSEAGTQSRTVTSYACQSGSCRADVGSENRSCNRDTDGASCGSVTTGSWGSCGGFGGTCDQTGTQTRTVSTPTCSSGSCDVVMTTQTQGCTRNTNGTSCGTVTNGPWGACGYSGTCDESASRTRTVTTPTCSSGSCSDSTSMETGACSRDTDGTMCGTTTYGGWSGCTGFSTPCDETGTRSRTETRRECSSGTCSNQIGSQSEACSRSTNGNPCLGPPTCGSYVCNSGTCFEIGGCTRGTTCCEGTFCAGICP